MTRPGAADAARRAIEGRKEAVSHGFDLVPAKALETLPDDLVVSLEHVAPTAVAEVRGPPGGIDDVREEHRRQHPIGLAHGPSSGHEFLDLVDDGVTVAHPWPVVAAGQLDVLGARDVLG